MNRQRLFRYYCMSLGYPCFFHSSSIPSSCLHTRLSPVLSISHLFLPLFLIYWPERFFNIEQGERLFVDVTVGNKWGEWSFALLSLFPSFFPQFSFVFYLTFPLFLYICLPVCFLLKKSICSIFCLLSNIHAFAILNSLKSLMYLNNHYEFCATFLNICQNHKTWKPVSIFDLIVNRSSATELTQFLKSKSARFMYHEGKKISQSNYSS